MIAVNSYPCPTEGCTPAKPTSSTPATVADSDEITKAEVLVHHTRVPAKVAAAELSPIATSVRPKGRRDSHTARRITAARMSTA